MSLSDDIFDVEDALKGKPEAACFDRITDRIRDYELWQMENEPKLRVIADFRALLIKEKEDGKASTS